MKKYLDGSEKGNTELKLHLIKIATQHINKMFKNRQPSSWFIYTLSMRHFATDLGSLADQSLQFEFLQRNGMLKLSKDLKFWVASDIGVVVRKMPRGNRIW